MVYIEERFKAQLVAKGFTQVLGLQYDEIFNVVVKPTTIKLMVSIAISSNWPIKLVDIKKNAILYGKLREKGPYTIHQVFIL